MNCKNSIICLEHDGFDQICRVRAVIIHRNSDAYPVVKASLRCWVEVEWFDNSHQQNTSTVANCNPYRPRVHLDGRDRFISVAKLEDCVHMVQLKRGQSRGTEVWYLNKYFISR